MGYYTIEITGTALKGEKTVLWWGKEEAFLIISLLYLRKWGGGEGTYSKGVLIWFQTLPGTIKVPTQHMVDKIRCFVQTYFSIQASNLFHYVGSPHMKEKLYYYNWGGTNFFLKKTSVCLLLFFNSPTVPDSCWHRS